MENYLISYDLSKPGTEYAQLIERLKDFSNWCHLHKSVWLISTAYSTEEIYDKLGVYIDKNDKLFVAKINLRSAVWTKISPTVDSWIRTQGLLK